MKTNLPTATPVVSEEEKQYVLDSFAAHFGAFREKRIVIYGIGKNTRHIIEHFPGFNILGLMDETRTGAIYGKTIVSKEEALAAGVEIIVIVARAGNVRIIHRRIAAFCDAHSVRVYDINGNPLRASRSETKTFDAGKYRDISAEVLRKKTENADVVSFDVFDTLVMRRTLYPQDIFRLAESRIGEMAGDLCDRFVDARAGAETELYGEGENPSIHEIYDRMQKNLGISDETKNMWKTLELQTEEAYLIPRERMCREVRFVIESGKPVYFVSDMYLTADIIGGLLTGLGINVAPVHILVSCDHGVSKSTGLFGVLRGGVGSQRILHIGDNAEADERAAKLYGIDDTFHIESAASMLEDSYAAELLDYDNSLEHRLVIGEFIARKLNDPFLFSFTQGRFLVENDYDMAYSFIAPLLRKFWGWMTEKALELRLDYIFFTSRDGYILERISNIMRETTPELPETIYFYTARAIAVLAGLNSDDDILYAANLAYAGSPEEMLANRFRLAESDIQARENESDEAYILRHREPIMAGAAAVRRNYLRYLDSLHIKKGARIGFFDFVSSGTCQKGLSNFTDLDLYGLYFLRFCDEYKKDLKIWALCETENVYTDHFHLAGNYFFMENVLSSFEATLHDFDDSGRPVFGHESRTEKQLVSLREIHNALADYFRDTVTTWNRYGTVEVGLPDLLFHFLDDRYSMKLTDYFETEVLEDEFCNRCFKISET
jgi:FMN phosphatase YigB (HAD superfamily)